ncbi:hypothetical protein AVEN_11708-1 [Araneus ventricosus]|uniref:Uncharacterized protein n=1 Tax=Araneus ventricosus TaxID=182803 RepID=A0A4Y2TDQ0_ARAVE|nr:hypothetical protein AVEN_11708-1 [Araneus ventricosus]
MDLDGLLSFLLDEIEGEERVSIATKCFTKYQSPKLWNTKHVGFKNRGEFTQTPSVSTLMATSSKIQMHVFFVLEFTNLVIATKLERCHPRNGKKLFRTVSVAFYA